MTAVLSAVVVLSACGPRSASTPVEDQGSLSTPAAAELAQLFTPEVTQGAVVGDPNVGAELFVNLPCAGCHGVTAEGQFGPSLAGTTLSFQEMRKQIRTPRDRMLAFDEAAVSDDDVRHIYAWLVSLPRPAATAPLDPP